MYVFHVSTFFLPIDPSKQKHSAIYKVIRELHKCRCRGRQTEGQDLYLQSSDDQQLHYKSTAVQDTGKELIRKGT